MLPQRKLPNARAMLIALSLTGVISSTATAAVVHESATMGASAELGYTLADSQFLGSRFTLTATTDITAVGGNIAADLGSTLFGAIVALSSMSDLPSDLPSALESYALGFTVFSAPVSSADVRSPLSLTLGAGTYALIFGSGLFGASGSGDMPATNTDNPGASYFF